MEHEYDRTPDPEKYGWCKGCKEPLSELDFWSTQNHLCMSCFENEMEYLTELDYRRGDWSSRERSTS